MMDINMNSSPDRSVIPSPSGVAGLSDMADMNTSNDELTSPRRASIQLGQDDNMYTTRYYIDHKKQTQSICSDLMYEECFPCCHRHSTRSLHTWFWALLRSEILVYTLHVTAIVFGVAKEAVVATQADKALTIVHSSVETLATVLLLLIRLITCRGGDRTIIRTIDDVEPQCTPGTIRTDPHIRAVRRYTDLHTILSFVLLVIAITCFVVFLVVDWKLLVWTLLTNNFCMITINIFSALLIATVSLSDHTIRQDQYKTTIYEAMSLIYDLHRTREDIKESSVHTADKQTTENHMEKDQGSAVTQKEELNKLKTRATTYIDTLENMEFFQPPSHITVHEDFESHVKEVNELHHSNHHHHDSTVF